MSWTYWILAAPIFALCAVWAYVLVAFVIEQIEVKREGERWRAQFEADYAERQAQRAKSSSRTTGRAVSAPDTTGRRMREAIVRVVAWLVVVVLPLTVIWQVVR